MPNPTRTLRKSDRLSDRQKFLVRKINKAGLTPKVYRRKGNSNKLSVHNPFLDVVRKAKLPKGRTPQQRRPKVQKYPHAYDPSKQRSVNVLPMSKLPKNRKGARKVKRKSFLRDILNP